MNYYLAYDLESGTLDPTTGDILTAYFAILDENFTFIEDLDMKLKPVGRLPLAEAKALSINGIDIEKHLLDPETIAYPQAKEKLTALIKKYLKKKGKYSNVLGFGYNVASFDVHWIYHHLMSKSEWESMVHYKQLDVMHDVDVLKRHGWLPAFSGSLGSMVEFFNVPKGAAHVARDDIRMTVDVYKKIHELMESKKNGGSTVDLISLLEAE
ncbi:MAG TPA: hypothetical protein VIJ14_01315 [Rhabdochlamydiaceae bacterium]